MCVVAALHRRILSKYSFTGSKSPMLYIYIDIVVMKRAIAMHRAQKATQQLTTAAPTETKGPTATNVVDHWGGAIPPSVLVLVVLLWI